MPVYGLYEKHSPVAPCVCPSCYSLVMALPNGRRLWIRRLAAHQRMRGVLQKRMRSPRLFGSSPQASL